MFILYVACVGRLGSPDGDLAYSAGALFVGGDSKVVPFFFIKWQSSHLPPVVAPPIASFGTSSEAVRPTTATSFVVELEQPILARAAPSDRTVGVGRWPLSRRELRRDAATPKSLAGTAQV